jgi:hypothetical protein
MATTTASRVRTAVGDILDRDGQKPPPLVQDRIKRGRDRAKQLQPHVDERWAFFRGDQYCYVNSERYLVRQQTVSNQDGTGKPSHRIRRVFNLVAPIVGHKVSAATSRIPGYEVNPSKVDPESQSAARLGAKVAHYGYDEWGIRAVSVDVVTSALVAGEGFAWPFFDTQIGPYISEGVGQGDVRVRTFQSGEVFWEPGVKFRESRWHAVEQARALDDVRGMPGFIGPDDLKEDAQDKQGTGKKLVKVCDYLERPTAQRPDGRWVTVAGGRQILPERKYPCENGKGQVVDEPVLHRLTFIEDPDSDRGMSLVQHLLDIQRAFNHANSKQAEWTQLALNPQVIVKNGKLRQKLNDVPGSVYEFWGGGDVAWRPVPPVPPELQQIKDDARSFAQFVAADQDIPQGVESGDAIQALLERDQSVWSQFYMDLAEFHSQLMRHNLYLVQRYYTEPRLLQIRGRFGIEPIDDFKGADLKGQADVTVLPGSIEPRTRKQIEAKIFAYADRIDPSTGQPWITPEQAMAAINGGTAEALVESYEEDISRATRIISQIRQGPQVLFGQPQVVIGQEPATLPDPSGAVDPMTGQPGQVPNPQAGQPKMAPNWMPRFSDNIRVWKTTFDDWFKTEEYERLEIGMQEAAQQVYAALLDIEAQKQQKAAEVQQQMAQGLGMKNAAAPQGPTPQPDQSQPQGQQSQPSPNQPSDQTVPPGGP